MNKVKRYKIKDTSKMHHNPWNKGVKTGLVPKSAFKKGHPAPKTAFKKGVASWNKGKPRTWNSSTEFKKGQNTGEKNHNWKGGITPENLKIRESIEGRLWKQSVFARDGFVCQKTKIKGCKLAAHHIQSFSNFPELRFAINNGITLSFEEHKKFHRKYGIKNNTMEQKEEFLNIK